MEQTEIFRKETIEAIREFCKEYGLPIEKFLGEDFEKTNNNCIFK